MVSKPYPIISFEGKTRLITMRSQPIVLRLFCLVVIVVIVDVVFVIVVVLDVDIVVKATCDGS